jgi:rare lipoprotein A
MKFIVRFVLLLLSVFITSNECFAQHINAKQHKKQEKKGERIYRGIASFYSNEFVGKKTASGEKFSQIKLTAACNILPLGTTVIVTNLSNGKKVKVKINDRLNRKNKRLIDLTLEGAKKLDFINKGLTRVKIEVCKK